MINLRYHIVSLTAVFLALGLGILAGTTVIDQEVVKGLRANTRALENDLDATRAQIDALERQIDLYESFADTVVPPLLQGVLAGRAVVLITEAATQGDVVRAIADTLTLAGARRPTRLTLTGRWALDQPATLQQLANVLGVAADSREEVIEDAAVRLATRLSESSDAREQADLIRALENAGFLGIDDLPQSGAFPSANAVVVVVPSGMENAIPGEDAFFVPFLERISQSRISAVAEPVGVPRSLAEKVRGNPDLAGSVCTADHADTVAGRLSLVYALRALALGRAAPHYGIRGGAQAVAPDVGSA